MKTTINTSNKSLEELNEIIFSLHKELKETQQALNLQKIKNAYLIEQFKLARQERFAPSTEKNVYQADLFDEAGIESKEEPISKTIEIKSHSRKKQPVRKALPADLPREVVIHDLSVEEKICICGCELSCIGEEITEQLKFIPSSLMVIQHVRPKYACKPCQETVRIAPMPLLLLPKTNATPELIAHTVISKYADHIPLYRQAKIWNRVDIDLPRSTLCSWLMKTGDLCEPLVNLLHKKLLSENYIQADESPVQVLREPGRKDTSKSYLWVYRGGGNVIFDYQQTRGGYHAMDFLRHFKGYLQTDAYSGYNFVEKIEDIVSVGCFAHARRPFAQLAKIAKKEGLASQALGYFTSLYAIESHCRDNNLTFYERHLLRNEKAPPILESLKNWLTGNITKLPKQHQLGKAMYYVLNNWDDLTAYLKDGCLEIDNNRIENLIRPLALGRKNFLFMGSPQGAKCGAIFYSLIATCVENNIDPYKYFCQMLHQVALCKSEQDYEKLLPQNIVII